MRIKRKSRWSLFNPESSPKARSVHDGQNHHSESAETGGVVTDPSTEESSMGKTSAKRMAVARLHSRRSRILSIFRMSRWSSKSKALVLG